MMAPAYEEVANILPLKAVLLKVNTQEHPRLGRSTMEFIAFLQ